MVDVEAVISPDVNESETDRVVALKPLLNVAPLLNVESE